MLVEKALPIGLAIGLFAATLHVILAVDQSFKVAGKAMFSRQFAHFGLSIDFPELVHDHKYMRQMARKEHDRLLYEMRYFKRRQHEIYINGTFTAIYQQLDLVQDMLKFTCESMGCNMDIDAELSDKALEDHAKSLQDRQTKSDGASSGEKSVVKRSIVGDVAAITALGLSLYNEAQILQLQHQVANVEKNQKIMCEVLTAEHTAIQNNSKHISVMSHELSQVEAKLQQTQFKAIVNRVVSNFRSAIINMKIYTQGLAEILVRRQIHPRFFQPDAMKTAFNSIKAKAAKHGLKPLATTVSDLFHEDVSFIARGNKIYFMLHVPVGLSDEMTLYVHHSIPIILNDTTIVQIDTQDKYLAINDEVTEYVTLTIAELRECSKRKFNYLCSQALTSKDHRSSCIASLFKGDAESVKALCRFKALPRSREMITETNANQIVLFSPPRFTTKAFMTCKNTSLSKTITIRPKEYRTLKLDDDCKLSTDNYVFRPPPTTLDLSEDIVSRPLTKFQATIDEIHIDTTGITTFEYDDEKNSALLNKLTSHVFQNPSRHPFWWIFFVLGSIVFIILIGAMCFLFHSRYRVMKMLSGPEPTAGSGTRPRSAESTPKEERPPTTGKNPADEEERSEGRRRRRSRSWSGPPENVETARSKGSRVTFKRNGSESPTATISLPQRTLSRSHSALSTIQKMLSEVARQHTQYERDISISAIEDGTAHSVTSADSRRRGTILFPPLTYEEGAGRGTLHEF